MSQTLARQSGLLFVGYGVRLGLQAAAFFMMASGLGPVEFGIFSGTLALASLVAPLADLGAYSLIVQGVAEEVPTRRVVGDSLMLSALLFLPALGLLSLLRLLIVPEVAWDVAVLIGLSTFAGARLLIVGRAVFVAHGMAGRSAMTEISSGVGQVSAAALLIHFGGDLHLWSALYAAQSIIVGGAMATWVLLIWGRPCFSLRRTPKRARDGLHYAISFAAQNASTDLDKSMLARLSGFESTGIYSAGHRIISVAQVPLMAYMAAVYPQFFRIGATGYREARRLARRASVMAFLYGAVAAAALWLSAPLVAAGLGTGYGQTAEAIRLLSLLMVIQSLQYPFSDAMSGSGLQHLRSRGQLLALVANGCLNLWLIPQSGWQGAAWATVSTQAALLLYVVLVPLWYSPKAVRHDQVLSRPRRA